jgi:hypothetical protein
MIDISKIKPGDFVTVRAKVFSISDKASQELCIVPDMHAHRFESCIWVLPSTIVSHEPAPEPLKVGDMVAYDGRRYTIIGLYRDQAWLEHLEEAWCFVNISQLLKVTSP